MTFLESRVALRFMADERNARTEAVQLADEDAAFEATRNALR